jgi:septation ring formation regulator EzrA
MANKKITVKPEAVEKAKELLEKMPEPVKDFLTLPESLEKLRDVLKDMYAKGHSYEAVAETLQKAGIEIKPARLRALCSKLKICQTRKRRSNKKTGSGGKEDGGDAPTA